MLNEHDSDEFQLNSKIDGYLIFCDSKEVQEKLLKNSTENETEKNLNKKREREKDEEEMQKEKKEIAKEEIIEEQKNENVLLYSDDENEKEIKDDSSSSSSNEDKEYYDENFDVFNIDQKNDDKYEEYFGVTCNQITFQKNDL